MDHSAINRRLPPTTRGRAASPLPPARTAAPGVHQAAPRSLGAGATMIRPAPLARAATAPLAGRDGRRPVTPEAAA